jgi:hypothetical protein
MPYSALDSLAGLQQIALFGLPDTTSRQQPGMLITAVDNYWGAGEFIYVRAAATIRQGATCALTPAVASGAYRFDATEVGNTANLGQMVGIAMTPMTVGQFGWLCISGVVPALANATVAANTATGIVAAGQLGANSAGKQIVNARVVAPATTTVVKANSVANSGSNRLQVTNSDGWFIGAYLSGTGIAAGTTITDISPDGTQVTLSAATTAAVNGSVTATYNNATIFYNVLHINRPFAQGAIT